MQQPAQQQDAVQQFYNSRLSQYRRERRKFSLLVYSLVTIAILISVAQWLPMILFDECQEILKEYFYISISALMVEILTVSAFIFCENIRFITPINWLLTFIIVESLSIGLGRVVIETNFETFIFAFITVAVYMMILIAVGIFIPHDMTLDVVVLFVCAVIFFIGSVFFVLLHILVGTEYSLFIYVLFVILTVTLFTMYHAQTIHGGRYAQMRRNDYLLATLIIYHDFVIIFMLSFYLISPNARIHNAPENGGAYSSSTLATTELK